MNDRLICSLRMNDLFDKTLVHVIEIWEAEGGHRYEKSYIEQDKFGTAKC